MVTRLRLRKFSPIDREYPIYEVLDGDQALFDIGRNDLGMLEVGFHPPCVGRVMSLDEVEPLIAEAKKLLMQE